MTNNVLPASNPFDSPGKYREIILKSHLLELEKINVSSKSLACLFLTRFCVVGCPFCFFKSSPQWRKKNIEDQFSDEGLNKFIKFSKESNLSYLLISGGGEPLNQKKHILKIIENVTADKIVLVTSGNWAKKIENAESYLSDMYEALKRRTKSAKVVVRVSISEGHSIKLGVECAKNIINIFGMKYIDEKDFVVQIKAFEGDATLQRLINELSDAKLSTKFSKLASDNQVLIKRIPKKYILTLKNGYNIVVGVSKIFWSSLNPDLNRISELKNAIEVVENDVHLCEDSHPSVVYNNDGSMGLDWSINFNGNICLWQNQVRDTYMNLYEDSYNKILETYLNDPITYSIVEKGTQYRDNIISEINPLAVLRSKAIGLRDSTGAILFEEEKTRLYYVIRVLQDFINEGRINNISLSQWPEKILLLVQLSKENLKKLYKAATYNIVSQQIKKTFEEAEWYDLLELIKLGHYDLTKEEVEEAIKYYNEYSSKKIKSLSEIEHQIDNGVVRRLTERLTHIKDMKIEDILTYTYE